MRAVLRLTLSTVVLAFTATQVSAQSVWKTQASGTPETVRAVDFIDADHGWAVADYGVGGSPVLVTSDGGVTWTVQALISDAGLQAVDFVDAQHGWIGGGYGIAYATTDGGLTWTHLTLPDNANTRAVMGLKFADTQHGWIVGQMGAIYGTVDGGAHWTVQPSGVSVQCNNIDAVSATHAWVGCESGILLSTTDGGLSWSAQFPFGSGLYEMVNVDLIDDLNGFILTFYEVKKTTNGGLTWTAVNAGEPWYKFDATFIDPLNGWLIGYDGFNPNQHGVISRTSDGGATWQAVVPSSAGNPMLLAASFVDADHGWVVGMNGTILSYLPDLGTRALTVQKLGNGVGTVTSSPAGINCGTTCTADFVTHATISLTATPGANSVFTGWSGACSGTAACVVTLDESQAVSATFAPTYPIEVTLAGSGSGHVSAPAVGLACAPTCAGVGIGDGVVVFTAAPDAGSWFAGWSGACNSSAPTCTVQVKSATSVVATFTAGTPPAPPVITPGIWTAQNSPTPKHLRAVDFVDASNGWAVGDGLLTNDDIGRILHTTDGGATWTIQHVTNDTDLWGVDFVDLQHGWAVGYAKIYATTDGGATWTTQALPCCAGYGLHDVSFADPQHGWIVGILGQTYGTSDGGAHWISQGTNMSLDCNVVQAISPTTAWRGCSSGLAFVTRDGGATWDAQNPFGVAQQLGIVAISFIDDQQGWLATTFEVRKTTDGGLTWTPQTTSVAMQSLVFTDAQHGWAIGSNYYPYDAAEIAGTVDGGAHWTMQVGAAAGNKPLLAAAFADGNHGWAVGFDGTILAYAPDTGLRALTVLRIGSGTGTVTSNVPGINCGAACLAQYATNTVVILTPTADAGSTFAGWSGACSGAGPCAVTLDQSRSVTAVFKLLYDVNVAISGTGSGSVVSVPGGVNCTADCSAPFPDGAIVTLTAAPDAGSWFAGWSGACNTQGATCTIQLKSAANVTATFNAGAPPPPFPYLHGEWTAQISPTPKHLRAVDFVDAMNGWAVGDGLLTNDDIGRILHTTDGGATWTIQHITNDTDLWGVDFVDAQHGWAVGYAKVYATTDGGATWTTQALPCCAGYGLHDVSFADAQHGWIVGVQGQLYATSDGGAHWVGQYSGSSADCNVIQAINASTVWRGCWSGLAFVTHDGGATWEPQFPFGVAQQFPIVGISFIDDQQGWLATAFEVRKTTDGGLTWTPQVTSVAMQGIVFTDAQHGWVVGTNYYPYDVGMIATTTDGGAHWTEQVALGVGNRPLTAVAFADGNYGWAVGFDGTILAYAPKDVTPPQIVASVNGTPGNADWYRGPVTISFTIGDFESAITEASGCDPLTFSADTAGQIVTCSATSDGGTSSAAVTVKVDQSAPVVTVPANVFTATQDPAGMAVTYEPATATDAMSGVDGPVICSPSSGSHFSIGATAVSCAAADTAGNGATATFTVNVRLMDATPPSIVPAVAGIAGSNGWYRSDVAVSFAVSDAESAVTAANGCEAVTVTTDDAGRTFACSATSEGGTATDVVTIRRDATAPLLTVSGDVAVTATSDAGAVVSYLAPSATDSTSGLASAASCAPASGMTFAIGTTLVTCLVSDQAGNSTSRTFSVTVAPQTTSVTGRMHGDGSVVVDNHRVRFDFNVVESDRRGEHAHVEIRISRGRNGRWDDDRFESRVVSDVAFSDAPTYSPGKNPRSGVDTVVFTGTGRWDRRDGYTYTVTASDRGEPGRNVDTFAVEVKAPNGQLVFSGGGAIADGNVQSNRIKR